MEWIEINHEKEVTVEKVFCDHRGGFTESINTTIKCPNGIEDLLSHFAKNKYLVKFGIENRPCEDDRLPDIWGKKSYPVHGIYIDGSRGLIGWCNFLE